MTSVNSSVYRATHLDSVKFGGTAWTSAQFASNTLPLDSSFAIQNPTDLLDVVGVVNENQNPTDSAPFAKEISFSGNERSTSSENLLGADAQGTQNQESNVGPASLQEVTMTLVYRNNQPLGLFNDSTKSCLIQMNNNESVIGTASTGLMNIAFNNITMLSAGSLSFTADNMAEQTIKFSHKAGTTGTALTVNGTAVAETWVKIKGGDYAEEVRTD